MMDYDTEPELTGDQPSIAERAGYRGGEAAQEATSGLRDMFALRSAAAAAATPSAAKVAQRHAAAEATAQDDLAASDLEAENLPGSFGDTSGSGAAGSETGGDSTAGTEVSATTDMGEQAHVGGTGVVSAASAENLDTDDADTDEQVAVQRVRVRQAAKEQEDEDAAREAHQHAQAEVQAESDAEVAVTDPDESRGDTDTQVPSPALPQRLLVRRGDPDSDAAYVRTGMAFDGSASSQIKEFPSSLEKTLRADLAMMTNESFATKVPLSQLVTAYVASQLGAASDEEGMAALDANTATALRAFRMTDNRTGSIEATLAALSANVEKIQNQSSTMTYLLAKYAEKSRLLENGLTYLITERLYPTPGAANLPAGEVPLMGGKYRKMRDRLRKDTDREIRDEKINTGRPMR